MVGDRTFWVNARLGLHRRIETRLDKNIDGSWFYRVVDLGIFARVRMRLAHRIHGIS